MALEIEIAAGAAYQNRYEEMLRWAEQARAGALAAGQRALAVAAAGQIALARYFLGLPGRRRRCERAAAGFDALDDAELAGRARPRAVGRLDRGGARAPRAGRRALPARDRRLARDRPGRRRCW